MSAFAIVHALSALASKQSMHPLGLQPTLQADGSIPTSAAACTPRIVRSDESNVAFNLATEDFLLMNAMSPVLYLWMPRHTALIGRHQETARELNLAALREDGVPFLRRKTGGGAIFLDPGQVIFCFIAPSIDFDAERQMRLVADVVTALGVQATPHGRNDIVATIDGSTRKISGNAYRHMRIVDNVSRSNRTVSLHHGTVLVNANKSAISTYLTPHQSKLVSHGARTVATRVGNLNEVDSTISTQAFAEVLAEAFAKAYGTGAVELVNASSDFVHDEAFKELLSGYSDDELSRAATHTAHFETYLEGTGFFSVYLTVQASGRIEHSQIYSDALLPGVVEQLQSALVGVEFHRDAVSRALEALATSYTTDPRMERTCAIANGAKRTDTVHSSTVYEVVDGAKAVAMIGAFSTWLASVLLT